MEHFPVGTVLGASDFVLRAQAEACQQPQGPGELPFLGRARCLLSDRDQPQPDAGKAHGWARFVTQAVLKSLGMKRCRLVGSLIII